MVVTTLPLTLTLAFVVGVYMCAAGLAGLVDDGRFRAIVEDFRGRPALAYVTGVFVYAIGVAIVMAHNNWADPLAIVVTLLGWAAIIEGLVLIVAPKMLFDFAATLLRPGGARTISLAAIVFAAVLMALGLLGRAG